MNLLSEALSVQNEPFSTTKRTRRVVSTVNDIVHHIFSHVQETNKIISITSSTHDVNINRCDRAITSIQHLTHAPAPPIPSSIPASTTSAASAFSILAAAATAAAIRTTSFDGVPDTMHQPGRPSSSSWEASAAEAELSTDFIGLSVAATSLADRVRAFTEGHREPPVPEVREVREEDNGEWKQQLSPEAAAAVAAASAAEEREQQLGRRVHTVVGKGRVVASSRTDGFLDVELDWTLANDQHVVAYVLESSLR